MRWIINLLTSSIGQKLVMSLTGLFLCSFLLIHLVGNLQLLYNDGGQAFNKYAYFMTNNPVIKTVSYGLYAFILLHAIQGFLLAFKNKKAKGSKYAVRTNSNGSWASKNMALLGTLVLFFILIHMGDFWWNMKMDRLAYVSYDGGVEVKDLYAKVYATFNVWWLVLIYLVGLLALAVHLLHGFSSAFQTLGLRHKKYTPIIKFVGYIFSILIPIGFAIIPIAVFFSQN